MCGVLGNVDVLEVFDEVVNGMMSTILSLVGPLGGTIIQIEILYQHNLLQGAFFIERPLHFCWTFINLA